MELNTNFWCSGSQRNLQDKDCKSQMYRLVSNTASYSKPGIYLQELYQVMAMYNNPHVCHENKNLGEKKREPHRSHWGCNCECLRREMGCKGQQLWEAWPPLYGLKSVSIVGERLAHSLHCGTQSCLMPFEELQTFKRVSVPDWRKKEIKKKGGGQWECCRTSKLFLLGDQKALSQLSVNSALL